MEIRILHIDDEADILEIVKQVVDGETVSECTLRIKNSCGFEDGLRYLEEDLYDLVILDLCIGNAAEANAKVGEDIFKQIQARAFVPVIFFTGLPEYVKSLQSDIVKVVGKGEGYEELFKQMSIIIASGFLKIRKDVDDMIREGVRSYFWNFVHKNTDIIAGLKEDDVSLKYLLLRRLGKSLSSELIRSSVNDPQFKKEHSHPMEFYIFPPVDGEYETGDLVRSKKTGDILVILTPSCDFEIRKDKGGRNAEKILLANTLKFTANPDFIRMKELEASQAAIIAGGKIVSKEELGQLKNLIAKVKNMMSPGWNERYFFLPPTPFIEARHIDFQYKKTVTYEQLETEYDLIASLDDPIAQAVLASYSRYYARVGYKDLDIEYSFKKIV